MEAPCVSVTKFCWEMVLIMSSKWPPHPYMVIGNNKLSQCMRIWTMCYVRQPKPQISLRLRAVWSEPLLVAWVFYDCSATDWTLFGNSKLKRRLQRLVRVYTCQNVKLLEISCIGFYFKSSFPEREGRCEAYKVLNDEYRLTVMVKFAS